MKYELIECPFCEGSGLDPAEDPDGGPTDCPECHGTGQVSDDEDEDEDGKT